MPHVLSPGLQAAVLTLVLFKVWFLWVLTLLRYLDFLRNLKIETYSLAPTLLCPGLHGDRNWWSHPCSVFHTLWIIHWIHFFLLFCLSFGELFSSFSVPRVHHRTRPLLLLPWWLLLATTIIQIMLWRRVPVRPFKSYKVEIIWNVQIPTVLLMSLVCAYQNMTYVINMNWAELFPSTF